MELLARGLFAIPAVLGQGDHWYLTEGESGQIGTQANAALTSLPTKRVEQLTKIVNVWAPWIGLTLTLVVCTIARINVTRSLYVAARTAPARPAPNAPTRDGGSVPGNGAAPGTGPTKNRVTDILRESEGSGFEPGAGHPEGLG